MEKYEVTLIRNQKYRGIFKKFIEAYDRPSGTYSDRQSQMLGSESSYKMSESYKRDRFDDIQDAFDDSNEEEEKFNQSAFLKKR